MTGQPADIQLALIASFKLGTPITIPGLEGLEVAVRSLTGLDTSCLYDIYLRAQEFTEAQSVPVDGGYSSCSMMMNPIAAAGFVEQKVTKLVVVLPHVHHFLIHGSSGHISNTDDYITSFPGTKEEEMGFQDLDDELGE
ncbi:hypothetical protein BDV38DRAFT_279262 [Aspergillus pseudotamarii]|uniref:Uncharacterized protein n=1 Tax=Aspergillus pseudotamarii TaxID=132259 RepID=A0A5N6T592_ASPPS|nr:uncharacterized protein BDV38DRAFT_279262 [Aspergillus pseudotamarii]KAE8141361.1 hypothetical protein BDV38DRAFT_279262 [Aspergillus pseudotamarii]